MMLAGVPVRAEGVGGTRQHGQGVRRETTWPTGWKGTVTDGVKLLALTLDERALMLAALKDHAAELTELRAVLLADHQWRRGEGLD